MALTVGELKEWMREEFTSIHLANSTMSDKLNGVCNRLPLLESTQEEHQKALFNSDAPEKSISQRLIIAEERQKTLLAIEQKRTEAQAPSVKIGRWAVLVAIITPFLCAALTVIVNIFINS